MDEVYDRVLFMVISGTAMPPLPQMPMSRTLLILAPYGLIMSVRDLDPRCKSKKLIALKTRWACGGLLDTNLGVRTCANTIESFLFPLQKMTGTTEMHYMPCELTAEFYF